MDRTDLIIELVQEAQGAYIDIDRHQTDEWRELVAVFLKAIEETEYLRDGT